MAKAKNKTNLHQVIDDAAAGKFGRAVFNQSFSEFTIKCQEYNPAQNISALQR